MPDLPALANQLSHLTALEAATLAKMRRERGETPPNNDHPTFPRRSLVQAPGRGSLRFLAFRFASGFRWSRPATETGRQFRMFAEGAVCPYETLEIDARLRHHRLDDVRIVALPGGTHVSKAAFTDGAANV